MRLPEGIVLNQELTFGELKFSALRRESFGRDEDGNSNGIVERRVYDLKSKVQEQMIQVSLPADVEVKEFPYNSVVELVNPKIRTITNARGRSADTNWYLEAEDIVLKKAQGNGQSAGQKPEAGKEQKNNPQNQQK